MSESNALLLLLTAALLGATVIMIITAALGKRQRRLQKTKDIFKRSVLPGILERRSAEGGADQSGGDADIRTDGEAGSGLPIQDWETQKEEILLLQMLDGLKNNEFEVYIHWFVENKKSRKIVGGEALSRWNHPRRGLLMPSEYVPLMEKKHIVALLDYYIMEKVCQFLEVTDWQQSEDFFISCNFSRDTFAEPDFAERCAEILKRYQFSRKALVLELTETGSAHDKSGVYRNAEKIKEWGISVVLDDFGEGYTSFGDLQSNRFSGLKLDKNLIQNISTREGEIILSGIIEVGHRLGMTVIAEGVETEFQAEKLKDMHCDVIQGFYFHKPMPLREAADFYLTQLKAI